MLAKEIFQRPYLPNDAKGRMVAYYIIQCITKDCHLTLPVGDDVVEETLNVDVHVVRFHTILPPHLPTNKVTLFVPASPRYTDVDFLLFDPQQSSLYSFQVTVQAEPWAHSNTWIAGTPQNRTIYDEWLDFCSPKKTTKIWVVATSLGTSIKPKGKGKPKKFLMERADHRWVKFGDSDVQRQFPALQCFNS
jgi:hypothetical protein